MLEVRRCEIEILGPTFRRSILSEVPFDTRGLYMEWDYSKSYFEPFIDFNIRIYNYPDELFALIERRDTTGKPQFNKRTRIILRAGYGSMEKIVEGEIYFPREVKKIGQKYLDLQCTTLRRSTVQTIRSISERTNVFNAINNVANIFSFDPILTSLPLSVGNQEYRRSTIGTLSQFLAFLKKRYGIYSTTDTDNDRTTVSFFTGDGISFEAREASFTLSSETGLIEIPVADNWVYYRCQSKFNPRLTANSGYPLVINVQSPRTRIFKNPVKCLVVSVRHQWSQTAMTEIKVSPSGFPVEAFPLDRVL